MAQRTPASRNRYVDFLRAVSIGAVVFGHWLIAAPWIEGGQLRLDHMLALEPWTRWLTLLFQVMPVFFVVGGYANAASWEAAKREGQPYGAWAAARMRRLVGPVLPLFVVWAAMAVVFHVMDVRPARVRTGSQLALVPVWFLAVYVLVVLLVPVTRYLWVSYGIVSFWGFAIAAALVDLVRFAAGFVAFGWLNYLFVWLGVHHLGYLWRDGGLAGPRRALPWAIGGALAWICLVLLGPYPMSMVGVPGEEVSNTMPPTILLMALGAVQTGLLLAAEGPMRDWLARTGPWAAVVLINGTIMSVYLWHLTALGLLVGLAALFGGIGLHWVPGTGAWWAARIPWFVVLSAGLIMLLALVGGFERLRGSSRPEPLPAWRTMLGAALVSTGLALAALGGIGSEGFPWFRLDAVIAVFAGAALLDIIHLRPKVLLSSSSSGM
jgi:fucose 4-O-acetylase-like acetyltransferase